MKPESLALLILAAALAPAATLAAYGAQREHWPHIAGGLALLAAAAVLIRFLT